MGRLETMREKFAEQTASSLLKDKAVPWQHGGLPVSPVQSAVSGRAYSGANALYLMQKCAEAGYQDSRFITFNEVDKNDLRVRKGEHGVPLEHWKEGKDGKIEPRIYTVFNIEQLEGDLNRLPPVETVPDGAERAKEMLKNAGVEMSAASGVRECQNEIKKLVSHFAEEAGYTRGVHTPELIALRKNMAATFVMREAGLPVEQAPGLPTESWGLSIKRDPSQLYKAVRDGQDIARGVIASMTQDRERELFQASRQRQEAQKAQEVVAEAVSIPRGADFNLPDADLSATQEAVVASAQKASAQVSELRESASRREASASPNRITEAREVAKKHFGSAAVVTSAQAGRSYGGKIIGVLDRGPDKTAIQAISDNHAVLHTIKDKAAQSALKVGEDLNLAVGEDGGSVVQGREAREKARKSELAREGMKR